MTGLIVILCIILVTVVTIQIGKVTELAAKIKGEEKSQIETNKANGRLWVIFGIAFFALTTWSAFYFRNWMLGFGPHDSASEHGYALDNIFMITLIPTYFVFILTHILLIYFAWKYSGRPGRKVYFQAHDTKLEIIWTAIPAVVMALLVMGGLDAWNEVMADVEPGEDYMEIEATGMQFNWMIRYPGPDGKLGSKYYKNITALNPLGQDWTDTQNLDDFHAAGEFYLPKGKKVRVRITSRDVLHNFDLPHFRVKMDAVPGIPTHFVFTPIMTTEEYRAKLKDVPEYQALKDPNDPESGTLWENFEYELACAELCGKGHFSMKMILKVVEEDEYNAWLAKQSSYYMGSIRGGVEDPYMGDISKMDEAMRNATLSVRKGEFDTKAMAAMAAEKEEDRIVRLTYVNFVTGGSALTELSKYELGNVVNFMKKNPSVSLEVAGHTDSTGELKSNIALSQSRAESVYNFLVNAGADASRLRAVGYGPNRPVETNDTEEGRAANRRTEFQILMPATPES